jgi:hypothetical protein
MTTLNNETIIMTAPCDMCNVEHTWQAVPDCSKCLATAHGPSHVPFKAGHAKHCSCSACW